MSDALRLNARDLEEELSWLIQVLNVRLQLHFGQECQYTDASAVAPPDLSASTSEYARFVTAHALSWSERVALALALAPLIRPQLLDVLFVRNRTFERRFTEFGGAARELGHFHPTGETLAFILAGNNLEARFAMEQLFDPQHLFARAGVLGLGQGPGQEGSFLQAPLRIAEHYASLFTTGRARRPVLGADFPAQRIETALEWDDLVLHPSTREQVMEILTWIKHGETLMNEWGMAKKLRPGHRSLFYGPPGTGKTMTACLLGKSSGRDVYRVDLSLMVSKYIGETEKNLAKVFDQAQHKGWILFFDEADALFGKRSETKDAHDRFANQEVSFLLQRIETFDGITVLASNLRENIDDAFARRFESLIYFPMPRAEERARLWKQGFPAKARLDDGLDLPQIAREHALSGGAIMNAIRYASLQTIARGDTRIADSDLLQGIRREYIKERKAG